MAASGDPSLGGPLKEIFDMIQRLTRSERAEQVFVGHVFRFWVGRNETIDDAPIPREAGRGCNESGCSFGFLLPSIASSDAFLYRKT